METRRSFLKKSAMAGMAGIIGSGIPNSGLGALIEKDTISLNQAWDLHRKCLIIDGHNDTPVERMTARNEFPMKWMDKNSDYQADIPRMREGRQKYNGFMIISAGRGSSADAFRNFAELEKQFETLPNDILQVNNSSDVFAAGSSGRIGVLCAIEGGWGPLGGKVDNLKKFYDQGLRLAGISHGEGGPESGYLQGTWSLTGKIIPADRYAARKTAQGLTSFGLDVLKMMNELGIVTDLSHINDKAYFEVIEKSSLIPIVSHTAVWSLCQQGRCLTDDQIKAIADRGGVIGITFVPEFIDNDITKATINRFIDHIRYVVDMVGIDHVGVGTDYDGGVPHPVIPEVSRLVELTQGLMTRGFNEDEIKKIWGGNFLRILQNVIDLA